MTVRHVLAAFTAAVLAAGAGWLAGSQVHDITAGGYRVAVGAVAEGDVELATSEPTPDPGPSSTDENGDPALEPSPSPEGEVACRRRQPRPDCECDETRAIPRWFCPAGD